MSNPAPGTAPGEATGPATAPATRLISPAATDEQAAAIMAAMQVLWPQPVLDEHEVRVREATWRFSGRWWAKPVPARRGRPFM